MKRQWRIQRTTITHPNGQQRWDQAYQRLLQWEAQLTQPTASSLSTVPALQEESDANSRLCACLDQPPSGASDD